MNKPMTLLELQAILGERIKIANTETNSSDRKEQNEQSQMICALAKQMINLADVVLRAEKLTNEVEMCNSTIQGMIK
jgi:hypothetical protein